MATLVSAACCRLLCCNWFDVESNERGTPILGKRSESTHLPYSTDVVQNTDAVQSTEADRAFLIVYHTTYGFLLLQSFKHRKGLHFQLPGGHVDRGETPRQAAARELLEETKIDLKSSPERMRLLNFPNGECVRKGRCYYFISIADNDSAEDGIEPIEPKGCSFRVKLSDEHVAFTFVPTLDVVVKSVKQHSGGNNSIAVRELSAAIKSECDALKT